VYTLRKPPLTGQRLRISIRHYLIVSAVLLSGLSTSARAQQLLYYPISARVTSMGQAGAADNTNPSTIVLNPANVIGPLRLYAQGSMLSTDIEAEDFWIRRANAGATWRFGPMLFGVDLAYARLHFARPFYISDSPQKSTQDVVELTTGLGASVGSNDFLVGIAGKRLADKEEVQPTPILLDTLATTEKLKADAYAFDAGAEIRHRGTLQGWDINTALGAAIMNVGNDLETDDGSRHLPRHFNGGFSVQMVSPPVQVFWGSVPLITFLANVDAAKQRDVDWEWMAGTEVSVWQILFLRTGIHTLTGQDGPDPSQATWGFGAGLPLRNLRVRFDYGREGDAIGELRHFELTAERTF
jgi:hypothetical protein